MKTDGKYRMVWGSTPVGLLDAVPHDGFFQFRSVLVPINPQLSSDDLVSLSAGVGSFASTVLIDGRSAQIRCRAERVPTDLSQLGSEDWK